MLEFFRRYQRYFFLLITVVIIISFSFFGTYNTLEGPNYRDQVAFKAVDGEEVSRAELEQMNLFLASDMEDKLIFGGLWGPNFLNDGVVVKNFLQTGLAEELAVAYASELEPDLQPKLEKERRYKAYEHPQAPFLSAENVWRYVLPGMKQQYDALRQSPSATSRDALQARFDLYLAQRQLPAPALRQLLMYQMKQFGNLKPDLALEQGDLFIFGYHSLNDWFGQRLTHLMAAFIINSAKVAEQRGYKVSKQEALSDLMHNAEISYRQNSSNPNLGVTTSTEYFNEQLSRMGLNANQAANIWRQVLLFRRLFEDAGNSVFVDPYTFQKIASFAKETAEGQVYQWPKELSFGNLQDVNAFEAYLAAIRKTEGKNPLALPTQFLSAEEVAKKTPELVQKRYILDIASVDINSLQAKVPLKEMWNWEADHWNELQKEFPELALKKAATREEKMAALDGLDDKTRNSIDLFARKKVVEIHPEWLAKALEEATAKRMPVSITLKGGSTPIVGLTDRADFLKLIDSAKLKVQEPTLKAYSADKAHYYNIVVLDRSPELEIVTYAEAKKNDLLSDLAKNSDSSALKKAIIEEYAIGIAPQKVPDPILDEIVASLRFYAPVKEALAKIQKDPKNEAAMVRGEEVEASSDQLSLRAPLTDQWKLIKVPFTYQRGGERQNLDLSGSLALNPKGWSKIQTPASGTLFFYQLEKKGVEDTQIALGEEVTSARRILGGDAERTLMAQLLAQMKAKRALSLADQERELQ